MGPASSPGPRNQVNDAVAVAGVLQPFSNLKFATVNSFVSKLLEFEPYSAARYLVFGRIVKLPYSVQP